MVWQREQENCQTFKRPQAFHAPLASFIARIPQRYIVNTGKFLGILVYILDRRHRRIVRRNLQFTHPDWSRERIRELSRSVFQNLAITILEVFQMNFFSRQDLLAKVRIRGEENLLSGLRNPKGAIFVSAHLGNWEMSHLIASCYLSTPLLLVAKQLPTRILDRWVHGFRTRFGSVILDKKGALAKMARVLRQGRPVGLLIDQGTTHSEGVNVTFFGQTVTATPAAALLARRYNSPVLPAFCVREASGSLTLIVDPPLSLQSTKDLDADVLANTQIMNYAVEQAVNAYPEQWFWFHKRWKRHYPHLYPEDLARRQRRRERRRARMK